MAELNYQDLMADPANWCPPQPEQRPLQDRRQLVDSPQTAGSICQLGWRPLLITGVLRRLMISHFSNPKFIEDPALNEAIWQNAPSTGILIESVHRWIGSLVEKRPAILLKRNAYQNMRITLNDYIGADEQGNDDYTTLWVGSHTLFCIHGTGASCEILATEAQRDLTQFAPVVKHKLGLVKFSVTDVGAVSEIEESQQNYLIPITVGWAYQESWKLVPEALPIRQINLDIRPSEV
jgi:hypothetical protein